jgi:RES domain.
MDGSEFKDTLTPKEQRLVNKIQEGIHYCLNCQARDSGEWIWVLGKRYDLEDLLDDFEVKEEIRDKIVDHLSCPHCGTSLNRGDEVGIESPYDKEINNHVAQAKKKYGKKISEFKDGLKRYPTLALQYSLAKEIFKEIKDSKLPCCTISGTFFRARKVANHEVLQSEDFLNPPIGKSEEGRFNHSGQSHFYLAKRKDTAIYECLQDERPTLLWIQQFTLKKINKILDLSFNWDFLTPSTSALLIALHESRILMQSENNKEKWKPDYYITRFIMDCAKNEGYKGIMYNSVKDSTGINVVLFDCKKDLISRFGKPKITIYKPMSVETQFSDLFKEHLE